MFGAVGSFGGMLFVAAAGWVSENFSYEPIFAAVGVMHIVSAIIVMLMIPHIKIIEPRDYAATVHTVLREFIDREEEV